MISKEMMGVVLGGIMPAILYALSNVFAKSASDAGLSKPLYLILLGLTVLFCGLSLFLIMPDKAISYRSAAYGVACGLAWALGTSLFVVAISYYGIPLSKLVPLNNTSTLFSILFGFLLFAEWQQVSVPRLVSGAVLIVIGSIIVSKS